MAMDNQHVTIGEIFRICQRIETQVTTQNGRVRKLEEESIRTNGQVSNLTKSVMGVGGIAVGLFLEWLKRKLGW